MKASRLCRIRLVFGAACAKAGKARQVASIRAMMGMEDRSQSSRRALNICGTRQASASVGASPWQYAPVSGDSANMRSSASRPAPPNAGTTRRGRVQRVQFVFQIAQHPQIVLADGYRRRSLAQGARARAAAPSAGSSGGCGCVSSRYSIMAIDCVTSASASTSVGTSALRVQPQIVGRELLAAVLEQMNRRIVVGQAP